jgi:hypothetical protein
MRTLNAYNVHINTYAGAAYILPLRRKFFKVDYFPCASPSDFAFLRTPSFVALATPSRFCLAAAASRSMRCSEMRVGL